MGNIDEKVILVGSGTMSSKSFMYGGMFDEILSNRIQETAQKQEENILNKRKELLEALEENSAIQLNNFIKVPRSHNTNYKNKNKGLTIGSYKFKKK